MDKRTRMTRWEQLDEDLAYIAAEVDRTVTARDQIRTVLTAYRDRLGSELFPGRTYVPKTLDLRQGRPPRRGDRAHRA